MAAIKVDNPKPLTDGLRKRALELRLDGLSYPAIGKKLSIEFPWSAVMSALNKLDEVERKKAQAQIDKITTKHGYEPRKWTSKRESKPKTDKAAKSSGKKDTVRAVPKPKDKKVARPKGAPSRVKTPTDKAQLSDAQRAAEIDAKREQSPMNMTRSEREKLVKAGKLPTADLAQLQKLEARKNGEGQVESPNVPSEVA